MLVKSFLAWMETAPAQERAEAVDILAQAYLQSTLGGERPQDVEAALSIVLDDPSPQVRRVLASAFAESDIAPRHIVLALTSDEPDVSALLVAKSPILVEPDLIDLATMGEGLTLNAVALRVAVSVRVSHALIKRNKLDICIALLKNEGALIAEVDLIELVAKHGKDKAVQEAILARKDTPVIVRHMVMILISRNLVENIDSTDFIPKARSKRLFEEAIQNVTLGLAANAGADLPRFITHLRQSAQLTPGLLFRSLLTGNPAMLLHAIAELSELDVSRVCGVVSAKSDTALLALLRRSGIPSFLEAPMVAGIRVVSASPQPLVIGSEWYLPAIRAAIEACIAEKGEESLRLLALLRRYEMEASRLISRQHAQHLREIAREDFMRFSQQEEEEQAEEDIALAINRIGYEGDDTKLYSNYNSQEPPDLRSIIAAWKRERAEKQIANKKSKSNKQPSNKRRVA